MGGYWGDFAGGFAQGAGAILLDDYKQKRDTELEMQRLEKKERLRIKLEEEVAKTKPVGFTYDYQKGIKTPVNVHGQPIGAAVPLPESEVADYKRKVNADDASIEEKKAATEAHRAQASAVPSEIAYRGALSEQAKSTAEMQRAHGALYIEQKDNPEKFKKAGGQPTTRDKMQAMKYIDTKINQVNDLDPTGKPRKDPTTEQDIKNSLTPEEKTDLSRRLQEVKTKYKDPVEAANAAADLIMKYHAYLMKKDGRNSGLLYGDEGLPEERVSGSALPLDE